MNSSSRLRTLTRSARPSLSIYLSLYLPLTPPFKSHATFAKTPPGSRKPDLFEGLRFDFTKPFNQNFALCHSFFLGNVDVPSQSGGAYKMAVGTYEFGANLVSQSGDMMIGRVMTDGRLTGRVKKDLLEDGRLSAKVQAQLSPESSGAGSQVMLDLDSRGSDWNGEGELVFFVLLFLETGRGAKRRKQNPLTSFFNSFCSSSNNQTT